MLLSLAQSGRQIEIFHVTVILVILREAVERQQQLMLMRPSDCFWPSDDDLVDLMAQCVGMMRFDGGWKVLRFLVDVSMRKKDAKFDLMVTIKCTLLLQIVCRVHQKHCSV